MKNYIVSVSGKIILPADEPKRILEDLEKAFYDVHEVSKVPWNLTNGTNEVIYRATFPDKPQNLAERIWQVKKYFEVKHRIVEFFELQKVG